MRRDVRDNICIGDDGNSNDYSSGSGGCSSQSGRDSSEATVRAELDLKVLASTAVHRENQ
jgi:hypothetical protein